MSQTIDVTGLPEPVVRDIQQLITTLRFRLGSGAGVGASETPEQWVLRLTTWARSHPKREVAIADDRESIYAGRGE